MRVVIVNRHMSDYLGGSEMQCHNIANGLSARGHEVAYVAPHGSPRLYEVAYRVVAVEPDAGSIASQILDLKPDVVYWRFNKYKFRRVAATLSRNRIPLIFAVSHIDDTKRMNYLTDPSKGLLGLCRAGKEALVNAFNYGGFKFVSGATVLNPEYLGILPVPFDRFVPNSVVLDSVPFHWPRPYVVWVANLKKAKRPEAFVRLAKELAEEKVDFLMVGDIVSHEYEWVRSASVSDFYYLGKMPVENVNGVLRGALGLVHTCEPEGFGNNFIQAWLAGKPTISLSFDPGGFIAGEKLGAISHNDFAMFVEQVRKLINDTDWRRITGSRAKHFADATFSLNNTVDGIEAVLKLVAETTSNND